MILQTAAGRDETVRGLGMDTCGTPNLSQFLRLITIKKQGWYFWSECVSFSGDLLFTKHWCQQSGLWNVWVIFLTSWFGRHRLFGRSKNWVAKMSPDHSLSPSCCSLRLSRRFLQQQKSLWLEAGSVFFFGLMGIFGWIKHPLGFFFFPPQVLSQQAVIAEVPLLVLGSILATSSRRESPDDRISSLPLRWRHIKLLTSGDKEDMPQLLEYLHVVLHAD